MGAKDKRGGKAAPGGAADAAGEVERLIAKGWLKDAVKQAKVAHRDAPSPATHRLLERAYLLRATELRDGGMAMAAVEVATHLVAFGVTDPALVEPAAALLMAVGMASEAYRLQGRLGSPEANDRLARIAADRAVLRPDDRSTPRDVAEVARRVRAALEFNATAAVADLGDIARSSPFAEWRIFARGLAAFRRGDEAETQSSWARLDPDRAAARIARGLRVAADPALTDPADLARREKLERWAFGEPVLGPLRDLADVAVQREWGTACRKLGPVRLVLGRLDPMLAIRLTQALIAPVAHQAMEESYREGTNLIRQFTRAAEPLPIDPRWDRLWALVWEGPQGSDEQSEPFWKRYLDQLDAVPGIPADRRETARALILAHRGRVLADDVIEADLDDEGDGDDDEFTFRPISRSKSNAVPGPKPVDPELERDRQRAVDRLEASLKILPGRRATYEALIELFESADQPDRATAVVRRLVAALPDDFDGLTRLAEHDLRADRPADALASAIRARRVKPLDAEAKATEAACRRALARHHALAGRFDEGRTELAEVRRLHPEEAESAHFAAQAAALERRAGQAAQADALIAEASKRLDEPTSVALAVAIEAARHQLPKAEVNRAEARWAAEAAKKVRGAAAGALARLMNGIVDHQIDYPNRGRHTDQVADYLRRTTRIKYEPDDLRAACGFLHPIADERELLGKLARRGLKLAPDRPEFPLILAMMEMEKGPAGMNLRQTRRHFELALQLAEARRATDPRAAEMINRIKDSLEALQFLAGPFGFGFPMRGSGPSPSFLDAFAAMMGRDLDDDDDDDDEPGPAPAPRPKPGPKPKPKKKR